MARAKQKLRRERQARDGILFKRKSRSSFRSIVLLCACGYFVSRTIADVWFPEGQARRFEYQPYGELDLKNTQLKGKVERIYTDAKGPETVLVTDRGTLLTMTEDGLLVEITPPTELPGNGTSKVLKNLGVGRPLGGKLVGSTLYIADVILGLTVVRDIYDPKSNVELLVSEVDGTRLRYTDDVDVVDNKVYFTDSTDLDSDKLRKKNTWDLLYTSKVEFLRGKPSGRVICYDLVTREATVLMDGLLFANGISVQGDSLYVAETFGMRIHRYNLKTKQSSIAVDKLPGYPDGVDCGDTFCYSALPTKIIPFHKLCEALPGPLSRYVRTLSMMAPKWILPKAKPFGGIVKFNAESAELLLDPLGETVTMLTAATVTKDKLYLGSLSNNYVGVLQIEE